MKSNKKSTPIFSDDHIPSYQQKIDAELITTLYQQAHTALLGVIATATGIAVVFFNEVSAQTVTIWLVVIYSLSFIRYLSIKKFKALNKQAVDIIKWGWIFSFFAFLSGLSWGAASIIFFTPDNLQLFNILTLIIIAMSVGSLAALSAFPKSYYLFVIPAMTPMIWRYLSIDTQSYIIFGVLLFVFNFALFSIVRVNHRILKESITLRFENVNLINKLTVQKENSEQANIAKTKFLASASHDMRQPIHAIGLFLGILEDRVEEDDQKIIVHKIQRSTNALSDLLDSLLDISKLDAGIIQIDAEPFHINSLFEALKNELEPYAHEKGLKIKFVHTELCVNNDFHILERITRNLLSNAIKYTDDGGVLVGCRRYQGAILLAVYDTGIGIHENNIQAIFDEFYQLDNPERDRSKGLGLGLAIVRRMANLLDLPLHIKSVPGKGSVFGIVMPAISSIEEAAPKPVTEPEAVFFNNKSILIVEDEEEIRDSLCELLRSWHCDVMVSASGEEALLVMENNNVRPDIILADYRLRDNETGVEVINKINALNSASAIPAIIITGDTAPERIKEAENSGYKILHKPVSARDLRSILIEYLVKNNS